MKNHLISRLALKPGKAREPTSFAILDKRLAYIRIFVLLLLITTFWFMFDANLYNCSLDFCVFVSENWGPLLTSFLKCAHTADYKSCKVYTYACKHGRSNWSCFEKN